MWCLHLCLESDTPKMVAYMPSIKHIKHSSIAGWYPVVPGKSAIQLPHSIQNLKEKIKLFPTIEEANLRLSLAKVIKGSFHMARSDAHPLFQVVEISLGITNTSSLKVSSTDWKTKISTNICGLVASQNGKGPTFHKFPRKDSRKTSQTLGRSNPKNHPEPTPSWRLIARMAWKTFAWFGGPEL